MARQRGTLRVDLLGQGAHACRHGRRRKLHPGHASCRHHRLRGGASRSNCCSIRCRSVAGTPTVVASSGAVSSQPSGPGRTTPRCCKSATVVTRNKAWPCVRWYSTGPGCAVRDPPPSAGPHTWPLRVRTGRRPRVRPLLPHQQILRQGIDRVGRRPRRRRAIGGEHQEARGPGAAPRTPATPEWRRRSSAGLPAPAERLLGRQALQGLGQLPQHAGLGGIPSQAQDGLTFGHREHRWHLRQPARGLLP